MIVDWQYEPIKGALLHVDLKRIAMDKMLRVSVPVVLKGDAAGREDCRAASWSSCCAKSKSSACRPTFRRHRCRREPAGVRPDLARVRSAARRQDQVPHGRGPDGGARHRSEGRSLRRTPDASGSRSAATTAEPEVIKKGKQETEGAAEGGEARRPRRRRRSSVLFLLEQQIATSFDALLAMTTRGGMAEDGLGGWPLADSRSYVASLLWMTRESDGERGGVAGWPRQRGDEA